MKIALDAMGGDFGPDPLVSGADLAYRTFGTHPVLVGDQKILEERIRALSLSAPFEIVDSKDVIAMTEKASDVRRRRGSTVWMATELVKRGEVDGAVSAGHSGASLASAMWVLGRLEGVERPAIGTILPSLSGHFILVDGGANVDCKPSHLVSFAHMGRILARHLFSKKDPRVFVLSNGEEESKGNELVQKTIESLRESRVSWFSGPVESRDIFSGEADVVVCDGFVGNVVLKEAEGLAQTILGMMREAAGESLRSRIGGLLLRPSLSRMKKRLDYAEYGGAPLLGVNGLFVISHGRSNSLAISNAMGMADRLAKSGLTRTIAQDIAGIAVGESAS
ncbi:MAG: phosphate acyltransferase PlsX [Nitrospirae bacterium]|nr:MAG: fatty acid/phospholipid synthesis protein [Leptospirillum sp. Group IV 'UBA BS']MCL4484919.1 phosphate acyltransferase PlsX [Nitrospirota bacterium]MCL5284696.1 phosphate acyltransferase PlsX [Nitrospirota bacterium]